MSVVQYLKHVTGKTSMWDILKRCGLNAFIDGNFGHTVLAWGPKGTFVGEDQFGNKYYEKTSDIQVGRDRWVVYADQEDYHSSTVCSDWHAWLHHVSDDPPSRVEMEKPIFIQEYTANPSGSADAYLPKGSWVNPEQRNWKKYEAWVPPQ